MFLHRRKLLDPGLSSSRQNMFLNLLYKSLKADVALRRIKAFVKRLLQVSAEQSASFTCGALFLVSEVMRAKPGLLTLLQEEGGVRKMNLHLTFSISLDMNGLTAELLIVVMASLRMGRRRSSKTSLQRRMTRMARRSALWTPTNWKKDRAQRRRPSLRHHGYITRTWQVCEPHSSVTSRVRFSVSVVFKCEIRKLLLLFQE